MSRPVKRGEILDYVTYEERRADVHGAALADKRPRRIQVGAHLMFLFENHESVRDQVQEMVRTEKIVKEADIEHELRTYNELLGGPGELGTTLMIGLDDAASRTEKLTAWVNLNETLYVVLVDGTRVGPKWDPRQVGDTRLSAVQYLKFDTGGQVPVAVGCSFDDPAVHAETKLSEAQRAALRADLSD